MSLGQMKTETYYDIGCDECGRHLSTDFHRGFASSRLEAIKWAVRENFKVVDGKTLCPYCARKIEEQNENSQAD